MHTPTPFLATFVSVVIGVLFLVMGVAFVTIPYNLGSHPGEQQHLATDI